MIPWQYCENENMNPSLADETRSASGLLHSIFSLKPGSHKDLDGDFLFLTDANK
jgi:hypothetical protein